GAAMGLELLCVPANGVGFAQVSDDPATLLIIDDRKGVFCSLAEAVERYAQIVSRKEKWGGRRDEILHRLAAIGASGLADPSGIDDAAQTSVVIDDEYLLDAAGRESSTQLVKRQARGDHRRITAHHRADQQLVDPPDIFWAADRQTAQMKAPGRKGIAEPMPHHDRGGDDPAHDAHFPP